MTHTYIKPSSNQRSTTPREAFAAGRLRSSRLHVEVTSFAAYFAVYRRSARITGHSPGIGLGKSCRRPANYVRFAPRNIVHQRRTPKSLLVFAGAGLLQPAI